MSALDLVPEIPTVDQCIDWMMQSRSNAREQLLRDGRFGHTGEGCSGPLHPGVTIDTKGLRVERPTPEQWETAVRWHIHCREHGYPGAREQGGYPPKPSTAGRPPTILVSWATLRARLEREDSGQSSLFT